MTQTTQKSDLADKIADRLFAHGAVRLVLELPDRVTNAGGWCRQAVIDHINEELDYAKR